LKRRTFGCGGLICTNGLEGYCRRKAAFKRTFRHTYSTLLRSTGAELKIMQELLRHSTIRVTLDTYTQAVTTEKRNAQEAVVALLFPKKTQETQALPG
jgi:integrase